MIFATENRSFFRFDGESCRDVIEALNLAFASRENGVMENGAFQQDWFNPFLSEEKKLMLARNRRIGPYFVFRNLTHTPKQCLVYNVTFSGRMTLDNGVVWVCCHVYVFFSHFQILLLFLFFSDRKRLWVFQRQSYFHS